MNLRPYQLAALGAIEDQAARGTTRQLLVMATGLGKTHVMGHLVARRRGPVLALMHRDELLRQMRDRFLEIDPSLRIGIEKAGESVYCGDLDVMVASVQTIGRRDSPRLARIPRDWPKIVIVDECHHSVASSYLTVLDYFGLHGNTPNRDILLLGATATPDRLDELGYDKIFDDVVFRYDLPEAIRDGWLADIKAWRIQTDVDLGQVKRRSGDFAAKELADAVRNSNVTKTAVETWTERCRGRRSLFFCCDKQHAHETEAAITAAGGRAATVVDDTPAGERTDAIKRFRQGDLEALINVSVLTEGFDVPDVEAVHLLRPTASRALYCQMLGRGTRKTATKGSMELYDYTGQQHDVASVGQIFGLPDSWELRGQSVSKDGQRVQEIEDALGLSVDGAKSTEDLTRRVSERRIDLIRETLADTGLPGKFAWIRPSRSRERWVISWRHETPEQLARLPGRAREAAEKMYREQPGLQGSFERLEILRNELGVYELLVHREGQGPVVRGKLDHDRSLARLVSRGEKLIATRRPAKVNLIKKSARWGRDPASPGQRDVLGRRGVPGEIAGLLTKREASMLIGIPGKTLRQWFAPMEAKA